MEVQQQLFAQSDKKYAAFQSKLTPTVPAESFIGVRVPAVRTLAKQLIKQPDYPDFFHSLPHRYYDENMLHGVMISELKDYREALTEVNAFLPYVDNWAVCDIMSPKVFKKHKPELIGEIRKWAASPAEYTCRFGLEMLMSHYLDEDFLPEYLEIAAAVRRDEYYVNMMIAWFFATALAKQWADTLPYLTKNRLSDWVHNKTIQKARESYRITDGQKAMLLSLKR